MKEEDWNRIPHDLRSAAILVCKNAGIDLEHECLNLKEKTTGSPTSPWMDRAEAASYAHVSTDTIDNWCRAKYIDRAKLAPGKAGSVLIRRESLEKFLLSRLDNRAKRIRKNAPAVKGGYRVRRTD